MFGNISNNASMVCYESLLEGLMMSCTTLIVYGKLINFTFEYKGQNRVVDNIIITVHKINAPWELGCQRCGNFKATACQWYKIFLVVTVTC